MARNSKLRVANRQACVRVFAVVFLWEASMLHGSNHLLFTDRHAAQARPLRLTGVEELKIDVFSLVPASTFLQRLSRYCAIAASCTRLAIEDR